MDLLIAILYSAWILGAVILIYFSIVHLIIKEYKDTVGLILAAAFPLTAFITTVICFAGLIRYFIYLRPKSFKQLLNDIKTEFLFDFLRSKSRNE